MNVALHGIGVLYSLVGGVVERLAGKTKGHVILVKLIHPFMVLLRCFAPPSFSRFTHTVVVGPNLMTIRPLVLSDLIMTRTNWEPYVQAIFRPRQGEVVVDVGAHIGFYTLKAAREVGHNGRVISIEPDPQNFHLLEKNIANNGLNNVIAINAALGDLEGQRLFYARVDPLLSSFNPSKQSRIREIKRMRVVTLDKVLGELGIDGVDWIKIDVEDSEIEVLRGGKNSLQKSQNVKIIIEASGKETIDYLTRMGFSVKSLSLSYYLAFKER